jgi:hypothetical protein
MADENRREALTPEEMSGAFRMRVASAATIALLIALCMLDILPTYMTEGRRKVLRELAPPGTDWRTVKPSLPLRGFKTFKPRGSSNVSVKLVSRESLIISCASDIIAFTAGSGAKESFRRMMIPQRSYASVELDSSNTVTAIK